MIYFYKLLSLILYPLLILLIVLRKVFNKEDKFRYLEKIFFSSFSVDRDKKKKLIWIHAASIGEVQSIFPLIEKFNNEKKNLEFLITTVTLSSGKLVEKYFDKYSNVKHRYFPLDVIFLVNKFLDSWDPNLIIFIDSEIWPNFLLQSKKRGKALLLVNARITLKTFKKWMLIKRTSKKIFESFDHCFASSSESEKLLKKLGAKKVDYYGNLKFCDDIDIKKIENKSKNVLLNKNFWCAASIHKDEEGFCIEAHLNLKNKISNLLTIIAPRQLYRSKNIKSYCDKKGLQAQILNNDNTIDFSKEVVILNFHGELSKFFKFAKSVFIGKSMVKKLKYDGGQNPITAAKMSCNIYHGPFVSNFREIYDYFQESLLCKQIKDVEELSIMLEKDFKLPEKNFLKANSNLDLIGKEILNKTFLKIDQIMSNENN